MIIDKTEIFIEKAVKIHGNKYDYSMVEYGKNNNEKVKIICKKHGVFEQAPKKHNKGQGCPKCKSYTNEEYIEKLRSVHGDKYDYSLINYINNRTKIKIICPVHGIFERLPCHYKCGCKKCQHDIMRKGKEKFIIDAINIHGNKYDYSLVEYINRNTKIKIICPIHGIFEQLPYNHLMGKECYKCDGKMREKYEIIELFNKKHNNKYDYSLMEYINSNIKIKIICNIHGVFEQKPNKHMCGDGCPFCKESRGEKEIVKILERLNISYSREKRFDNCKDKNTLPFDFYLPNYNICIEYDGLQHYKSINYWGGKSKLELLQYHDKIKTEYCKNNDIKLIRIKFDENIEEKLKFIITP